MSTIGSPERVTQNRVIALFSDELGYRYLGNWTDRDGDGNVEEDLLAGWLAGKGYSPAQIAKALHALRTEAGKHSRSLYANNQAVYGLLRYGVPVKADAGEATATLYEAMTWVRAYENFANVVLVNHGDYGGSFAWSPKGGRGKEITRLRGNDLYLVADVQLPVKQLLEKQKKGVQDAIDGAKKEWGNAQPKKDKFKTPPPGYRRR